MGLAPLRLIGLKILTYIDDCLIIADSREKVMQNTARVLAHITVLTFRVNVSKNYFNLAQEYYISGSGAHSLFNELPLTIQRRSEATRAVPE